MERTVSLTPEEERIYEAGMNALVAQKTREYLRRTLAERAARKREIYRRDLITLPRRFVIRENES